MHHRTAYTAGEAGVCTSLRRRGREQLSFKALSPEAARSLNGAALLPAAPPPLSIQLQCSVILHTKGCDSPPLWENINIKYLYIISKSMGPWNCYHAFSWQSDNWNCSKQKNIIFNILSIILDLKLFLSGVGQSS